MKSTSDAVSGCHDVLKSDAYLFDSNFNARLLPRISDVTSPVWLHANRAINFDLDRYS